ncbi:MAG: M55 family metallopeptidase [Bacilli bacterium]|jgi:D-amino peptidase|nr:M55 family metallopeptidase [Bacilli bacterium]
MKVFISADIEGVNSICHWDETEFGSQRYQEYRKQMMEEVKAACLGAHLAGAKEILVKDAHDSALNLSPSELPEYASLHRGWEGNLSSMMGGLDSGFDAVVFIGYHSPSRSDGNPLSHTMTTQLFHVKINGEIVSEFEINAMYASLLKVPVAFLSGDANLTNIVKHVNKNIETVATKEGRHGAVVSRHPSITNQEITDGVKKALTKDLTNNIVALPEKFEVEIQYKNHQRAYRASFFPGCRLLGTDRVVFSSNNYHDVLVMFHFNL